MRYMQVKSKGFILTMWYVNIFRATGGSAGATGFILTMWYVNYKKLA